MAGDTGDAELDVSITVTGHDPDEQQQRVLDLYEANAETFIRKNADYGGSFENSAKLESILRHGEVREDELFDIIAQQILVRGFYDKLSRFHQLQIQGKDDMVGEEIDDTLLDMSNYALMLVAMRRKYEDGLLYNIELDSDEVWDRHQIETFMAQHDFSGCDDE